MKIKKEPQCSSGQGKQKIIIIHSAFTLIDIISNFDKNRLLMGVCKINAVSQKLQHFSFNQHFPRSTIIYCLKSSNETMPVCWMGGCSVPCPARPQTKVFGKLARSSYMYTLIKTFSLFRWSHHGFVSFVLTYQLKRVKNSKSLMYHIWLVPSERWDHGLMWLQIVPLHQPDFASWDLISFLWSRHNSATGCKIVKTGTVYLYSISLLAEILSQPHCIIINIL